LFPNLNLLFGKTGGCIHGGKNYLTDALSVAVVGYVRVHHGASFLWLIQPKSAFSSTRTAFVPPPVKLKSSVFKLISE